MNLCPVLHCLFWGPCENIHVRPLNFHKGFKIFSGVRDSGRIQTLTLPHPRSSPLHSCRQDLVGDYVLFDEHFISLHPMDFSAAC